MEVVAAVEVMEVVAAVEVMVEVMEVGAVTPQLLLARIVVAIQTLRGRKASYHILYTICRSTL